MIVIGFVIAIGFPISCNCLVESFEHLPLSPNMLPQQEDRIFHLDPVALPWSVGDWTLTLPALERFLAYA